MAVTVTATQGGSKSNGMSLRVMVITGAAVAASQSGATASQAGAAAHEASITPNTNSSRVYGAIVNANGTTSFTASGATTLIDNISDATNTCRYGSCKATSLSTSGTPATIGASSPTQNGAAALLEIRPNGTLAEDASAPAVATTTSAEAVTTASFTPVAGSLLVALVSSDGGTSTTTMAVTDTGGGYTWTEKKNANGSNDGYAGVWIADVPSSGASVSGAVATSALAALAGSLSAGADIAGPTAAPLALAAPAGALHADADITGPTAPDLALAALAGTVSATQGAAGPAAPLTLAAIAGTVHADADITGPTAPNVALAAPAGTAAGGTGAAGPTAALALAAIAGTVHAGATIAGPTAPNVALAAPAGARPATPVFPAVPLGLEIDLLLAGTWTDITSYVYQRDNATIPVITRGRAPESPSPTPATFALQVNNRSNDFSLHNPLGTWYGSLTRNTPIRASVAAAAGRLRMEDDAVSYCSAPSSASLNVAGDLDLRIDAAPSNWAASVLASKWSAAAGNFSWAWLLYADGTMGFQFTTDGSTAVAVTSSQPLPWPGGRISLRVTYAHSTGDVTFYYSTSLSGSWTQIGGTVTASASGAIYAGTAAVAVGASAYFAALPGYLGTLYAGTGVAWAPAACQGLQGGVYEFQLLSGIAGTLEAGPQFFAQPDGTTTFADGQGNTWTCAGTAAVSLRAYRGHFEVSEWPPRWDVTGSDVYMPIQASGLIRRLQQKAPPLPSAMTRAWQQKTSAYAPLAYWPCEDGNNAQAVTLGLSSSSSSVPTQIASGLAGGAPMGLAETGTTFATNTDFVCSNALPVPGTATWTGQVPGYALPASNPASVMRLLASTPAAGDTDTAIWARMFTLGTVAQMDLEYGAVNSGSLQVTGYSASGAQLFSSGFVDFDAAYGFGTDGHPCLVEVAITTNGTGITWHVNILPVGTGSQEGLSGNVSSAHVGQVTQVQIAPTSQNVQSAIGQITVQSAYAAMDSPTSADALIGPLNGWAGETAGLRFARLCAEQGFASRVVGYPSAAVAMGAQTPESFMQLLQECESADHGIIGDARAALALGYRCSMSLCDQAGSAAGILPLALSYTSSDLGGTQGSGDGSAEVQPTDDDQLTVNDEIVTRGSGSVTGSSFEATLTAAEYAATAALSVAAPPDGVGLYQDQQTVNVLGDWLLGDQAGWLVHLGTVDELRYPVVSVNLARPQLAGVQAAVAALDLGDYLQITGAPAWLTYDAIKALIWQSTETLGGFNWRIVWATRPESPWEVLTAGTGALSDCRADTDGSSLATSYSSSATSLSVETAAGFPLWTTAAGDVPFDITAGGERMTVTAVSGSSSPQTFTVTRSVNGVVKTQAAGAAVALFQPCYAALA